MMAELIFALCFHEDVGGYRYLAPVFVWSAVLASGFLSHWRAAGWQLLASVLACFAVRSAAGGSFVPPQFGSDAARCIEALRGSLDLRAGLASYWQARKTELALGWSTQIDPIDRSGGPVFSLNDPRTYWLDIHGSGRPPGYTFIITSFLSEAALKGRFGPPERIRSCGSTTLWVYDDPRRLQRIVTASFPETGLRK
jgi:hypothetical protein